LGTLNIEFEEISTFHSTSYYDIRLADGFRYFGSFSKSETAQSVYIIITNDSILKPLVEIVEITPLKRAFWGRIDGDIDLGYSFSKATTVSEISFSSNLEYRYEKNFMQLKISSVFTDQQGQDRRRKQDYTLNANRFFSGKKYATVYGGAQSNTEQGVDLRLLFGGGVGSNLIHTNLHRLNSAGGLLVTRETSKTDSVILNFEGLVQINYKIFQFHIPEVDITSGLNFYPSFTTRNRYRIEYDIEGKLELIKDLYFSVSFYYNFDSEPVDKTAAKDDYRISTAIGFSF